MVADTCLRAARADLDPGWIKELEEEKERRSYTYMEQKVSVTPSEIHITDSQGEQRFARAKSVIEIKRIARRAFYPTSLLFYGSIIYIVVGFFLVAESPTPREPEGIAIITIHSLPLSTEEALAEKYTDLGLNIIRTYTGDTEYREYICPLCEYTAINKEECPFCKVSMNPTGWVKLEPRYDYHIQTSPLLQLGIVLTGLLLLFQPTLLSFIVHPATAAVTSAMLHLTLYSTGLLILPGLVFLKLENLYSRQWAPLFYMALALSLIGVTKIISHTMRAYSITIQQDDKKTNLRWADPEGGALADHLAGHTTIEADIWRRLSRHLALGRISRKKSKQCRYCETRTMTECIKCHNPICPTHTAKLGGYRVCLECFAQQRGKRKPKLR